MNDRPDVDDVPDDPFSGPAVPDAPSTEVAAQQRRHLHRIMLGFVVVVVLLPIASVGGGLAVLFLPLLAAASLALREAIQLRASVRRHGAARGR